MLFYSCLCGGNKETLPQDPSAGFHARDLASAGLNFHIASAAPFRNGCFAEFAGLASANAGSNGAVCLGKPRIASTTNQETFGMLMHACGASADRLLPQSFRAHSPVQLFRLQRFIFPILLILKEARRNTAHLGCLPPATVLFMVPQQM